MTDQQTLSALFQRYVIAGRDARELEIAWRESNVTVQAADRRTIRAWKRYKAEKDRKAAKKENP